MVSVVSDPHYHAARGTGTARHRQHSSRLLSCCHVTSGRQSHCLPSPQYYHWLELPQVAFLSRQIRVCRNKTCFLSRQTNTSRDKIMFVATKVQRYVTTKVKSRQAYFWRDKRETRVCRDKTFVATKMILVAAPANDTVRQSHCLLSPQYGSLTACCHLSTAVSLLADTSVRQSHCLLSPQYGSLTCCHLSTAVSLLAVTSVRQSHCLLSHQYGSLSACCHISTAVSIAVFASTAVSLTVTSNKAVLPLVYSSDQIKSNQLKPFSQPLILAKARNRPLCNSALSRSTWLFSRH